MIKRVEKIKEDARRISMMEKICQHCGYNWVPRVADPKECPVCKRRLQRPVNTGSKAK